MRGTWRRESFTWDPGRYELKALEAGISIHKRPFRENGRGSFPRDFERWRKGTLELDRLSLWDLCGANLKGGRAPVLRTLEGV